MKQIAIATMIASIAIASCKKKNTETPASLKPKVIYVAVTLNQRAAYTKNDTVVYLTAGQGTSTSIFVKGNDVYVLGTVPGSGGNIKTVYWKNGTENLVTDGVSTQFAPTDIAVNQNNEVIITGTKMPGFIAGFWKNGTLTPLVTTSTPFSNVYTVGVSGNDVYMCGYATDATTSLDNAVVWKNGTVLFKGAPSYNSSALDIAVSGSDIYVSGWDDNNTAQNGRTVYWKNGTLMPLSNGTKDEYNEGGLIVDGNDVYVLSNEYFTVGGRFKTITKYYKNGAATPLSAGANYIVASTMGLLEGKIYAGGYIADTNTEPAIWKNGVFSIYPSLNDGRVGRIRVY